jgi:hypothetical protein
MKKNIFYSVLFELVALLCTVKFAIEEIMKGVNCEINLQINVGLLMVKNLIESKKAKGSNYYFVKSTKTTISNSQSCFLN